MQNWLTTMMSVMAGGVLTIVAAWLADRRLIKRERERRSAERHERILKQRNDFQRETLLALQETTQKLFRATGKMLYHDMVEFRKSGKWQKQQLPEGVSEEHRHLITETMLLASRVRDNEIRTAADELRRQVSAIGASKSEQEAKAKMDTISKNHQVLLQQMGLLVRQLDEIE